MDTSTLKIYDDNSNAIVMPRVRYTLASEEMSEESVMMSGRIVKDILGYRIIISAEWEWVPADMLAYVVNMIRSGKFRYVEYQDVNGAVRKEKFSISQPEPEIFTFADGGTAVWRTVKLKMTAQEVTSSDQNQ